MTTETEQEELFFFGEFEHSLDSQCRVTLPSDWRKNEGDNRFILFPGRDQDLLLFPYEMFRDFFAKAKKFAIANREAQIALARIGRLLRQVVPDKQGRIRLEKPMLQKIGVDAQIKIVGAITHIKLCAPQNWQSDDFGSDEHFLDEVESWDANSDDPMAFFKKLVKDRT